MLDKARATPGDDDAVRSRWPVFEPADVDAVSEVLRSGKINSWTGPYVGAFEAAYAEALGRPHAIALANGTVALEVALRALGIGAGDEVIVSPRSFFASAGCVPYIGATPVFCDVDRHSQNITVETIAPVVTGRTRAIIVVHLAGWPADMPAIMAFAREHGLLVIEDCAQAHGAAIGGRPVGSFGDVACFSFCQDKIISTGGEGGLIAVTDEALFERAWSMKDHGKCFDKVFRTVHPPGFRWLHESFGSNLRMTSMQAVLGTRQLARLPETNRQRAALAGRLLGRLRKIPALRVPMPPAALEHAWYRAYAFVRPERLAPGWHRDRVLSLISAFGVPCFSGSCSEIYNEVAFRKAGLGPQHRLPVAAELGATSLAFQVDPTLSEAMIDRVAETVETVMARATGCGAVAGTAVPVTADVAP